MENHVMEDAHEAELHAYYERGEERDRLAAGRGLLEFTRTTEIVLRRLRVAPALVADIGGGPGRYRLWLAVLGYRVEHRDLVPLHVGQLKERRGWSARAAHRGRRRPRPGPGRRLGGRGPAARALVPSARPGRPAAGAGRGAAGRPTSRHRPPPAGHRGPTVAVYYPPAAGGNRAKVGHFGHGRRARNHTDVPSVSR